MLLFNWRSSSKGKLLAITIITNGLWAIFAVKLANEDASQIDWYAVLEVLRYISWYIFLLNLFSPATDGNGEHPYFVRWALPASTGFALLVLLEPFLSTTFADRESGQTLASYGMAGQLLLPVFGLAILEQLYRNTAPHHRGSLKYLVIGVGGIFIYDFYLYSDALLLQEMDQRLWEARGFVNTLAVPMLVIATSRNKSWSLNLFVSRDIVLSTSAFMGAGIYLFLMAGVGYYLREYGGSWGHIGRIVFFTLAIALLVSALFSVQLRARFRVFIAKHFYKNKYDYRREWLRLTQELNDENRQRTNLESAIQVLAQIVEARAGLLWLGEDSKHYINVASWNMSPVDAFEQENGALIQFLSGTGYIINLKDMDERHNEYQQLILPDWLTSIPNAWLIIPLHGLESLQGFIILVNPLLTRPINWEDRDLIKTAAKQVSSYLTVLNTSNVLAQAKQFEVFNRLSAYMVHDLKNIAAALEMVGKNADKHKTNPEFLEDAFDTVKNASLDIKRLLDQLRGNRVQEEKKVTLELGALVADVVEQKQTKLPCPVLKNSADGCFVVVEKNRLSNVLGHLIENAQQATADDGFVTLTITTVGPMHVVEIRDNGHGMDAEFIRNRLFKAFDTTKGNAGMGIGMHESRAFAKEFGGRLSVESEPDYGTVVRLSIPAAEG